MPSQRNILTVLIVGIVLLSGCAGWGTDGPVNGDDAEPAQADDAEDAANATDDGSDTTDEETTTGDTETESESDSDTDTTSDSTSDSTTDSDSVSTSESSDGDADADESSASAASASADDDLLGGDSDERTDETGQTGDGDADTSDGVSMSGDFADDESDTSADESDAGDVDDGTNSAAADNGASDSTNDDTDSDAATDSDDDAGNSNDNSDADSDSESDPDAGNADDADADSEDDGSDDSTADDNSDESENDNSDTGESESDRENNGDDDAGDSNGEGDDSASDSSNDDDDTDAGADSGDDDDEDDSDAGSGDDENDGTDSDENDASDTATGIVNVVDENGEPVAGEPVTLWPPGTVEEEATDTRKTDENGQVRIELAAGEPDDVVMYTVKVREQEQTLGIMADEYEGVQEITFKVGEEDDGDGDEMTEFERTVLVVNTNGDPVEGETVEARSLGVSEWEEIGTTDASGEVVITASSSDPTDAFMYDIRVDGQVETGIAVDNEDREPAVITLKPEEPTSAGDISITVTDAATDEPVVPATVEIEHAETGEQFESMTNSEGTAPFTTVPYGEYAVTVAADGYETAEETLTFGPDAGTEQTVSLAAESDDGSDSGDDYAETEEYVTIEVVDQNGDPSRMSP